MSKTFFEAYRKLHFEGMRWTPKVAFEERAKLMQVEEVTVEEIDEDGDVEVTEVVSDVALKNLMANNPFASGHNPFA